MDPHEGYTIKEMVDRVEAAVGRQIDAMKRHIDEHIDGRITAQTEELIRLRVGAAETERRVAKLEELPERVDRLEQVVDQQSGAKDLTRWAVPLLLTLVIAVTNMAWAYVLMQQ